MRVNKLSAYNPQFKNEQPSTSNEKKLKEKNTFLDKFETSIINSADLNDTVQVPRTIFKGYLAFLVGTALTTVAAMAKEKFKKTSTALNLISIALVTYGTYSFVRPYIIKSKREN